MPIRTMFVMGSSIVFLLSFVCLIYVTHAAVDVMAETQLIRDGETIVSSGGVFELGFFSPDGSIHRYLGIWYKKISNSTFVWVANREKPLNDSSGVLIVKPGFLAIYNGEEQTIWSSKASGSTTGLVVAQLLDSGNFVLRPENDVNPANYLWQSFDYPGDTFLPDMKIGINLVTGLNWYLTSWKSPADPSTGEYTCWMEPRGLPEFYIRKNTDIMYRSGPWDGLRFSGVPNMKPNPEYSYEFVSTVEEVYYTYHLINKSVVTRMVLTSFGLLQCLMWIDLSQGWSIYYTVQRDKCDMYALCGPNGNCDINHYPLCECLKGFVPKNPQYWEMSDWSGGCVRKKPLDCIEGEGFLKYSGFKLPDTRSSWYNRTMSMEECEKLCLQNCSCTAYANMDIRDGGSGCVLWFGDLIDMREYAYSGQDIYIRFAASELAAYRRSTVRKRVRIIVIPIVLAAALLVSLCLVFRVLKRRKKHSTSKGTMVRKERVHADENENKDLELPLFDFNTIMEATDDFSIVNKLGQGGFGPVYKGILKDGQQIAVKRLSRSSKQGLDEFKNEVLCISKLQHRNLVKLLGGCIEEDEWMLIYEYMPNKSLDHFVFDHKRETILNWSTRFHIIIGIARGLLYLHQDSRLRIIHRDLKASNILLDHEMNPKISDFGMARSFGGDESEGTTNRVVGTYGYMPPEYAIDGLFSVKSDVFSFGVLVLEIVSGKRNRKFSHPDHKLNLLGHAWRLSKEMKSFELIDAAMRDSCDIPEVLRSIQVALLCVQQSPDDRPNMLSVVLMLSSEIPLPPPKQPGFFNDRDLSDTEHSTIKREVSSNNALTITLLKGR